MRWGTIVGRALLASTLLASFASSACAPSMPAAVPGSDDTGRRMDFALERLDAKDYERAAAGFHAVWSALPESDVRRDLAGFELAKALVGLGMTQAGVEHYIDVVEGRHAQDIVAKSLTELKPLYDNKQLDRDRLVEHVIYGNQYVDLPEETADWVEYLQALTDIRHGFSDWGRARMTALAAAKHAYSNFAKYSLAVEHIARKDDDAAVESLTAIIKADDAPAEVKDLSRLALARILYERKKFDDAWTTYSEIKTVLRLDDSVTLEKAWDLVASGNQQRALGLLVGLGAPEYATLFAPDRDLIKALALRRLCQYRPAHLAVHGFREKYGDVIAAVRAGVAPKDIPAVRKWAISGDARLNELDNIHDSLVREQAAAKSLSDKALKAHLATLFDVARTSNELAIAMRIDRASERVADELLRVQEQMNIVDYEVGVGLFKSGDSSVVTNSTREEDIPYGSPTSYFRFDGEYWSDEIGDYTVFAEDRCVR
jgi:hypothetical protein